MTRRWLFLPLLFILSGCQHAAPRQIGTVATTAESNTAVEEFDEAMHQEGVVLFRSWNGKFLGGDSDTDLRFLPNSRLEMVEYGLAVVTYKGNYQVDPAGQITATFTGYQHPWPVMQISRDSGALELRPATSVGSATGWPFKRITPPGTTKSHE